MILLEYRTFTFFAKKDNNSDVRIITEMDAHDAGRFVLSDIGGRLDRARGAYDEGIGIFFDDVNMF